MLLLYMICAIAIFGLGLSARLTFGPNINFFVVISDSMVPSLSTGHIVITSMNNETCSSFGCLKIGDVIVFHPDSPARDSEHGKTLVHRIEEIGLDSDGQRVIRTKGDANPNSIQNVDYPITEDQYLGKVIHIIPYVGVALMYLDLLARVFLQPILYLIIGAVVATIILLEYQKKRGLEGDRRKPNSRGAKLNRGYA